MSDELFAGSDVPDNRNANTSALYNELMAEAIRMEAESSDGDIEDNNMRTSSEDLDDDDYDSDDELIDDAQEQWEESVEQLKKLFYLILLPLTGKFFGRRFAYYSWRRYVEYENLML